MTSTTERAKKIIENLNAELQRRATRYVPKNGQIYVYADIAYADMTMVAAFVRLVEKLTGADRKTFTGCRFVRADNDTATFQFKDEYYDCALTFDRSKVVIVGE
jgi:hypothetical protein